MSDSSHALAPLSATELASIVEKHTKFLAGKSGGARAVIESLTAATRPTTPEPPAPEPGSTLHGLVERVRQVHAARVPDLGAA